MGVVSILVRESARIAAKTRAAHRYVFVEPNIVELSHTRDQAAGGNFRVHLSAVHPLAEAARGHTDGSEVIRE
jgi:hypothetical protein